MTGRTAHRLGVRLALLGFSLVLVAGTFSPIGAAQRTPAQQDGTPTAETPLRDTGLVPVTEELGTDVSLSPDGQWLVTQNRDEDQLCLVAIDSGEPSTCLTNDDLDLGDIDEMSITWSPESQRLAFALQAARFGIDSDIFVVEVASGELTNLTDDNYDGPLISSDPDFESPDIDTLPTFTPDGEAISFIRSNFGSDEEAASTLLAELPATGGEVTTLQEIDRGEAMAVYWHMAWVADGTTLLYTVAHVDQSNADNGVWSFDRQLGEAEHVIGRFDTRTGEAEPGYAILHSVSPSGQTALVISIAFFNAPFDPERVDWAILDLATGETQVLPLDSGQGTERVQPVVMAYSPTTDIIVGASRVLRSETRDPPPYELRFYDVTLGEWTETTVSLDDLFARDLWDMIWIPSDLLYIGRTAIYEMG